MPPASTSNGLEQFFVANSSRIRSELYDFLRIPSVSARSEHDKDTERAAEWLATAMRQAGLETVVHKTTGHPIVVGRNDKAGPGAPTMLVYGHYDVQPAEPLDLWTSPPFEPTVREGRIYARGSVDDKGQLFLHVKAIEAHIKTHGKLPVNVIVLAEGEEEVGSETLTPFIEANAKELKCDGVIISDSAMFAPGQPSILSSLRGMAYFQIDVIGPGSDLHSGSYGGSVMNPATALARIIASFHDDNGRIRIDGFYDKVRGWSDKEREQIRGLPFNEKEFKQEVGRDELFGEKGYSTLERVWSRPTCELNGLLSGYTGEGAKTVLPSVAMAKVSCRLVPDQTPEETGRVMREHIRRVTPPGVTVQVTQLHGGSPWKAELDGPLYDAARRALTAAFGKEPVVTGEGGSIPVVGDFARVLGAPVLLMGFGLPGENAHAPDEWMSEENFEKGMRAVAAFWTEIAAGTPRGVEL